MPLVDVSADMGGMGFGSGTQRRRALGELAISDESEAFFERMARSGEFPVTRPVPMAAGDATFHGGWTLHRALPNTSNQLREVMTIIFFADGSRLLEPRYQERKSPFASQFAGLKPGDVAASDMTQSSTAPPPRRRSTSPSASNFGRGRCREAESGAYRDRTGDLRLASCTNR